MKKSGILLSTFRKINGSFVACKSYALFYSAFLQRLFTFLLSFINTERHSGRQRESIKFLRLNLSV